MQTDIQTQATIIDKLHFVDMGNKPGKRVQRKEQCKPVLVYQQLNSSHCDLTLTWSEAEKTWTSLSAASCWSVARHPGFQTDPHTSPAPPVHTPLQLQTGLTTYDLMSFHIHLLALSCQCHHFEMQLQHDLVKTWWSWCSVSSTLPTSHNDPNVNYHYVNKLNVNLWSLTVIQMQQKSHSIGLRTDLNIGRCRAESIKAELDINMADIARLW